MFITKRCVHYVLMKTRKTQTKKSNNEYELISNLSYADLDPTMNDSDEDY